VRGTNSRFAESAERLEMHAGWPLIRLFVHLRCCRKQNYPKDASHFSFFLCFNLISETRSFSVARWKLMLWELVVSQPFGPAVQAKIRRSRALACNKPSQSRSMYLSSHRNECSHCWPIYCLLSATQLSIRLCALSALSKILRTFFCVCTLLFHTFHWVMFSVDFA
jgi:hypothetical protein